MSIVFLIILGLICGSFINALVWRIYYKDFATKTNKKLKDKNLSILTGRSVCTHCGHYLSPMDLIPVISWLLLKGKCRYCSKAISIQYPLVELLTSILFLFTYVYWPQTFNGIGIITFLIWLAIDVVLIALILFDVKWFILPNSILRYLFVLALVFTGLSFYRSKTLFLVSMLDIILGSIIGGGIFYVIYQISNGKWIGGGDVKLGFVLGILAASPAKSALFIFIAAVLGSLVSVSLIFKGKLKRNSVVPFGPFLIIGLIIVQLFGSNILNWYSSLIISTRI